MGVSVKKVLLALNSCILFVVWILQLNSVPYLRDRTAFMFVGVYTLWMVTGLAHLKVFKVKAKLALLICQTALTFALALTDTLNRNLLDNRNRNSLTFKGNFDRIKRQITAIWALLWVAFAIFFILTILRTLKQFRG